MTDIRIRHLPLGLAVGCYCGLLPLLTPTAALVAFFAPFAIGLLAGLLESPGRWAPAFLLAAILLPPLPIPMGDSGPHVAILLAAAGFVELAVRKYRIGRDGVTRPLLLLTIILAASTSCAAATAGMDIAVGSIVRVLLFAIALCMFLTARSERPSDRLLRWLWMSAVASAGFACADFAFQFPAPAGFAPQYVWLTNGVYRRAQGVFYEASTFGNFCAFFLVMTLVAFSSRRFRLPVHRLWLAAGAVLFATALLLSYSRASLVNIGVAAAALLLLRQDRFSWKRIFAFSLPLLSGCAIVAIKLFPSFGALYWHRAQASVMFLFSATEGVLSGRVANWEAIAGFLQENPLVALVGIGYKTLAYSGFVGPQIVSDNVYLGMLVETGILGLLAVIWLNVAVLRSSWRAAHSDDPRTAFYATWIFCFWAGESVQMFSGDLLTYWRVLPLYFWVLGVALRSHEDSDCGSVR